ncbi:redoxin domain-containing protein [Chloroflexota bacterium]
MKCENCGQDNPPEAGFCGNCGTKLAAKVEPPQPPAPSPPQLPGKWLFIGGVTAVLAILGIIIGSALLSDGSETTLQTKTTPVTTTPSSEGSQVGNLAPDFQLQNLDGETISLTGLRGNPVMLNFWATWCGYCCEEMPYLQQIHDEWQDKGLILLTINKRESLSKVRSFMQDNGYSFPVLLDTNNDVAQEYNVTGIPATFFIDKDGIIQEWRLGSFPSKEAIEDFLSKIISPTTTSPTTTTTTTTTPITTTTTTTTPSITPSLALIPDANLEAAIREAINKPEGSIYTSDLEAITILEAKERGISDLTGLEYCINLQGLNLDANNISDISPLAELTNLVEVTFADNNISDISPLAGLSNLRWLNLDANNISDLSPLAGLTNLEWLGLGSNNISGISPLAGLSNLRWLNSEANNISDISPLSDLINLVDIDLSFNNISDISSLAGLNQLEFLYLTDNNINDISPLVENSGLSQGDLVSLWNNPLSTESVNVYIPQLEQRGIDVTY